MFARKIVIPVEFDGTDYQVTCDPLNRAQALSLLSSLSDAKDDEAVGRVLSGPETGDLMEAVIKDISPPIVDSDGKPVPVSDICRYAYFMRFVGGIAGEMVRRAFVSNP